MSNDEVALACLKVWSNLVSTNSLRFFRPGQYTILAGVVLSRHYEESADYNCIALGSGTKCLSQSQLPSDGSALHDSHAEIIARRGAILWILKEIMENVNNSDHASPWLHRSLVDGRWRLKDHVKVSMYISTLPCAFMRPSSVVIHTYDIPRRRCFDALPFFNPG